MLEKIKQHFFSPYFRQQESGKYVFYPWWYPGEGFFLNVTQKYKISFFVGWYFFLLLFYLFFVTLLEYSNVITAVTGDYCYLVYVMSVLPLYVLVMYIVTRGKQFLIIPKEERFAKPKLLWLLIISFAQVVGFVLHGSMLPVIFLIFYSLSFIYTMYVFVKILRTRGYYFTG